MAVKRALVTGCSRGIGRAVSEMLLGEGWFVFGASRTPSPLVHERFLDSRWDVGGYFAPAPDAHFPGGLDALVHCAAIQGPVGPLSDNDPQAWLDTIRVNLMGTYITVALCLPHLLKSDDGRILLFSGGGAFDARPFHTAYAASKAGVVSLMESLADELRDTTVTVNCVAPGRVPTGIHEPPLPDDGGEAMALAVSCVRHLLSPATRGLSGKTVSAPFDDWPHIDPLTVARVNASAMGTRKREPIALVGRLRMDQRRVG